MKLPRIGIGAAGAFLFATSLTAQLPQTWVSATGNDSTCTGTTAKPCASFSQAIFLTAPGGTVSVPGPGNYGPAYTTQSITIDGTGGGSINFAGDAEGILLEPSANVNIVPRNLAIHGSGTGAYAIYIASLGTANTMNVVIDGCLIDGFSNYGVTVGSNSPTFVTMRNTMIQGGQIGVFTSQNGTTAPVTNNSHVSLDHVNIQGATEEGVYTRNGNMDINNSNITGIMGSGAAGIVADTYAALNVQSTMITGNNIGVCIYPNSTAIIGTSTLVADNTTNNLACGGTVQGMAGPGPSPKL